MSITEASTELWRMSALELAEIIRSGRASSREIVETRLRRIDHVNPSIKAIAAAQHIEDRLGIITPFDPEGSDREGP